MKRDFRLRPSASSGLRRTSRRSEANGEHSDPFRQRQVISQCLLQSERIVAPHVRKKYESEYII
jgi:hypothetical protein